jgi:hypothetical protein
MQRIIEIVSFIFRPSFWWDFIAVDMVEEGRMMHGYE